MHFKNNSTKKLLSILDARESLGVCLASHILKLLNPALDRMRFSQESDSCNAKEYNKEDIQKLLNKFLIDKGAREMSSHLPIYELHVDTPSKIKDLISIASRI